MWRVSVQISLIAQVTVSVAWSGKARNGLPTGDPQNAYDPSIGRHCRVTLVQQASRAACIYEESFGCGLLRGEPAIWVRNCRGRFLCDGHNKSVPCGYPPGRDSYTCACGRTSGVLADLSSWQNVSKLGRAHEFRLPQWRECMGDYHKNLFKRKCLSNVTWKDGRLACEGRKDTAEFMDVRGNPRLESVLLFGCREKNLARPPPPGTAALPRSLLARAAPAERVPLLDDLMAKLGGNGTVRVMAVGMSVTSMFAGPSQHSPAAPIKGTPPGGTNWLARLVATLAIANPSVTIKADTHASGGLSALSLAPCPADAICSSTRLDRQCPDLLVLDFALGLGFPSTLKSVEVLLRFATARGIASVLLVLPDWCHFLPHIRAIGKDVSHHVACQRALYARNETRAALARERGGDPHTRKMAPLAAHYRQTAISMFDALLPLVAHPDAIDLVEFTQDGIHPAYWPELSNRGAMYSFAISDALAYALEPRALRFPPGVWDGSGVRLDVELGAARRGTRPEVGMSATAADTPASGLPAWLTDGMQGHRGVRCYSAKRLQQSVRSFKATPACNDARELVSGCGWLATTEEFVYDSTVARGSWGPLPRDPAKPPKPGITSLSIGDAVEITIDTTLASEAEPAPSANDTFSGAAALSITFLQSYEQVGVLQITCLRGCECTQVTVDTRQPDAHFALLNTSELSVSQARECRVRLRNVSPASRAPGGTKIKISQLGVSVPPQSQTV